MDLQVLLNSHIPLIPVFLFFIEFLIFSRNASTTIEFSHEASIRIQIREQ